MLDLDPLPLRYRQITESSSLSLPVTDLHHAHSTPSLPRLLTLDVPLHAFPPVVLPHRPPSAPAMLHAVPTSRDFQPGNHRQSPRPAQELGNVDSSRAEASVKRSQDMAAAGIAVPSQEPVAVMPLDEISRLLRLQKYQKRKCHRAQESLRRLLVAATRTVRVACASRTVQVTLADCIRLEDKKSFAKIYNAFEDACHSCLIPEQLHHLEAEPTATTDQFNLTPAFLDGLSPGSRAVVVDLLRKLRYDPEFVADRLEHLSPKEIYALLPGRALPRSDESIFGGASRVSPCNSRPVVDSIDPQAEVIKSQGYGSLLETLIHCPRASSATEVPQLELATKYWATVCARLIMRQSSGAEKLVSSVFNIFAHMLPWPGKARLEIWILQTLREGAFLLEQPAKQSFRARVEGGAEAAAKREARNQAFYTAAAQGLLDLLSHPSEASIVPPGALKICQAIFSRLHPDSQRVFPQFAIIKWLFPCFVIDAISLPESHGLLADHYLSETARQRILLEVVTKAQRAVVDVAYSWKCGNNVSPDLTVRVENLMDRFRSTNEPSTLRSCDTSPGAPAPAESDLLVPISGTDVTCIIDALFPRRKAISIPSDMSNAASGLQSSASSISGFSMFGALKAAETFEIPSPRAQDLYGPSEPLNTGGSNMKGIDESQIDSARAELDTIATNWPRRFRDGYDVLVVTTKSETCCTMTERWDELRLKLQQTEVSMAESKRVTAPQRDASNTLDSARLAVESLLWRTDCFGDYLSPDSIVAGRDAVHAQISSLFEEAISISHDQMDFTGGHAWMEKYDDFNLHIARGGPDALLDLVDSIAQRATCSSMQFSHLEDVCDQWAQTLKSNSQLQRHTLDAVRELSTSLRDKMWYVTEVRPTAHFDEVKAIANALRILGKPRSARRNRTDASARPWSGVRTAGTSVHLMSEVQILDYLSARPEHGGPNKLSDEQSHIVASWMQHHGIDNLCPGEERLHKLCMEVLRCLDATMAQLSVAPSGAVSAFTRGAQAMRTPALQEKLSSRGGLQITARPSRVTSLHTDHRSSSDLSTTSYSLSSMSSRDFFESRSPTLTHRSSIFSNATAETDPPSSVTSVGASVAASAHRSSTTLQTSRNVLPDPAPKARLRERLLSLLLSDVTFNLFVDGCESDRAFWSGIGLDLMEKHISIPPCLPTSSKIQQCASRLPGVKTSATLQFDYDEAFRKLIERFSATSNPAVKLDCLYEIDRLLIPYMAKATQRTADIGANDVGCTSTDMPLEDHRAKNTTEANVRGFRAIFARKSLRPVTILKDLQYIAAFTPAPTLQYSARGKAFYNAALAILDLKQKLSVVMLETADSIIADHSNNRGHERAASSAQQQRDSASFSTPTRTPSAEDIARYEMKDAANLLQITAKEGDATAQRELATLYLTHPELVENVLAPFARPQDVFTRELESKWRRNQDPAKSDPTTMCVAMHWMSLSCKSGDHLAKESLRQWEEMDSF